MLEGRTSNAVDQFPSTGVYRRPTDGSQLEPKHVAVNKIDKI